MDENTIEHIEHIERSERPQAPDFYKVLDLKPGSTMAELEAKIVQIEQGVNTDQPIIQVIDYPAEELKAKISQALYILLNTEKGALRRTS